MIEGIECIRPELQSIFFAEQREGLGDPQIHVGEMRAAQRIAAAILQPSWK
jgi:hypothetical protein